LQTLVDFELSLSQLVVRSREALPADRMRL